MVKNKGNNNTKIVLNGTYIKKKQSRFLPIEEYINIPYKK
jgi:hypothetical protein